MKRVPHPRFVISLFALLGCGLFAAVAVRADESIPSEPLENAASKSICLKYLPKDYWLAAELDCRILQELLGSPEMKQNAQYAQLKQMLALGKVFTGIDLEKEVDSAAVFLAGDIDGEPDFLFVVQGSFDNQVVEARLTQMFGKSAVEKSYKDTAIYAVSDGALCFPADKTILFGKEKLIHEAIDRLKGKKVALPAAVKKVLERTPGDHIVWAAIRPQAIFASKELSDLLGGISDLKKNMAKLECVSLSFSLGEDGLLTNALGYATDPTDARDVYEYLKARKAALLTREGANVFGASFLILSELRNQGSYVQGSFQLTMKSLEELWNTKVIVKPGSK